MTEKKRRKIPQKMKTDSEETRYHDQEARLLTMSRLKLRGVVSCRQLQKEVKRELNLPTYSLDTVHRDMQKLAEEWRATYLGNEDEFRTIELARIDDIVRELWIEWEKSKCIGAGNHAYIAEINKQLQERRKLLGLYDVQRIDVAVHREASPSEMTTEEIAAELERLNII